MGLVFIKSQTAGGICELIFHHGVSDVVLDGTYNEYKFFFVNMHPASEDGDSRKFVFQVNAVGGSLFDEAITSTALDVYHAENDSGDSFDYNGSQDQQNSDEADQPLIYGVGAENDQSCSGVLTLYNPASTDFMKHFTATTNGSYFANYTMQNIIAGYINTEAAIDEIRFRFNSGNIDAGTIYMYGVG